MTTSTAAPSEAAAPPRRRFRVDPDLLVLSALVVLINLPYFRPGFLPGHDTRYVFSAFSYFYSQGAVEHELPQWTAYGTFGLKATAFQFCFLSLSNYLFMLVGILAGVRDALTMFTCSIIGEQLLFLAGMHLLARKLFTHRLTRLAVCFSAVCGVVWYWQLFFNFRIYHLLPLTLYFLIRFTSEKRPEFFWATGLSFLVGILGCPPYFYPLVGLTLLLVCLGLGSTFWKALPSLGRLSKAQVLAFGLFAAGAVLVGVTLAQMLDGFRIVSTQRNAHDGQVTLQIFLPYGGVAGPQLLAGFAGTLPEFSSGAAGELVHYVCLLPLAGLLIALLRCRNPYFYSLAFAAGFLILFALGGTFASLVYRLPLMGFFRHVGYATVLAKILLLLAGGFGLDLLFSSLPEGIRWERAPRFRALAAVLLILWVALDLQIGGTKVFQSLSAIRSGDRDSKHYIDMVAAILRAAGYFGAAVMMVWPSRSIPLQSAFPVLKARKLLIAALLADGMLFQLQVVARMPRSSEPLDFPVHPMVFRERRDDPLDPATERRLRLAREAGAPGAEYHLAICTMFQLDPSSDLAKAEWFPARVASLIEARPKGRSDPLLAEVLGAGTPKLRLVSQADYAGSPSEAARLVSASTTLGTRAVLLGVPEPLRFAVPGALSRPDGTIQVTHFSANRLVVDVAVKSDHPVWLVYADAFHPGWHATVNGQPTPIAEADLAFKAVRLEPGISRVCFRFDEGFRTAATKLLAVVAVVLSCLAFAAPFIPDGDGGTGRESPEGPASMPPP